MSYVGVVTQYMCASCQWFASITQPIGYMLKIDCPMCDNKLKMVDSDVI